MVEYGVVLYANKTLLNSSAHNPFASSKCFFKPFKMTLLAASIWPFAYRYYQGEMLFN